MRNLVLKIAVTLFFGLLLLFLDNSNALTYFSLFLIAVLGIPHGATDHIIHNVLRNGRLSLEVRFPFLLRYLGLMAAYGLLWWFLPDLSLLIFLLISAYHFGEAQFEFTGMDSFKNRLLAFAWGSWVLVVILLNHFERTTALLRELVGADAVFSVLGNNRVALLSVWSFATVLIVFIHLREIGLHRVLQQLLEMALLAFMAWWLPLLLAFALFFTFWHSRDALVLQWRRLRSYQPDLKVPGLLKMMLPFTLLSLFGIAIIIAGGEWFLDSEVPYITLFFILISLLTLPHMLLMSEFYRKIEKFRSGNQN